MICFRCHDDTLRARVINARRGPWTRHVYEPGLQDDLSLRDWILHLVVHAGLHNPLATIGFLDAEREGGLMFWRWDPWNNTLRRTWRELCP